MPLTKISLQMQRNFSFSERQTVVQIKSGLIRHREKLRSRVAGLSESDLTHGESITTGFTQQPRQGRRQLSIDNEFHGTLRTAWSA